MFAGMCPFGVILLIFVIPGHRSEMILWGKSQKQQIQSPRSDIHQQLFGGSKRAHLPIQERSPPLKADLSLY